MYFVACDGIQSRRAEGITGAQIKAAIDLVQLEGGVLIGVAAINIDKNEATRTLLQEYRCVDLCNYAASDA